MKTVAKQNNASVTRAEAFTILTVVFCFINILLQICKVIKKWNAIAEEFEAKKEITSRPTVRVKSKKSKHCLGIITSRATKTILKCNGIQVLATNISIESTGVEIDIWATPLQYTSNYKFELMQRLLLERKVNQLKKVRRKLEF